MPDRTIGEDTSRIRYQTANETFNPYTQLGSVKDWIKDIASRAAGNSIMIMAISMAFAGPLAAMLEREPFGVHIFGEGSIGKSTTAAAAASVWGKADTDGFLQTWRNTQVAIEELASIYNNSILILDEVGELENPRDLKSIIFMLTGGQGKGRGKSEGGMRADEDVAHALLIDRQRRHLANYTPKRRKGFANARRRASGAPHRDRRHQRRLSDI